MEKEIKEIIEKNLPAQVGMVLRERLEKAERDENEIELLLSAASERKEEIAGLKRIISEYQEFDTRNATLEKREKDVSERERQAEIEKLKYELQTEKDKTQFTKDVTMGLVRNTEYKRTLFDTKNGPGGVDQYGNQHHINSSQSSDETKEAR